ncbi:hypothetical protein F4861DRAFT_492126 [Xylaria intraflava]|nr:hypothetical protein F4861DRAFT_492126 [Xylaria intraflava]
MASLMNKARKPKFELHLWIYDLNNVPLVAGTSCVKWNLPNSIHGEYRGRTAKCSIDKIHHRVTYNYSRAVSLRVPIDRSNSLSECPIEFEVLQEFPMGPGGRDERISLGNVRINLSEYVEESENFPRRIVASRLAGGLEPARDRLTSQYTPHRKPSVGRAAIDADRAGTNSSGGTAQHPEENDLVDEEAEEGIVRRYLLQDSRINSTLRIGILMVQVDGERNYVAPPLKSATVFIGGISGLIPGANEQGEVEETDQPGALSNISKSRNADAQDMYRRALAASWDCQPGELHADECIEDIFAGGSGWRDGTGKKPARSIMDSPNLDGASSISSRSSTTSGDDALSGTLRSSNNRHHHAHHMRPTSAASNKSTTTVKGQNETGFNPNSPALQSSKPSLETLHSGRQYTQKSTRHQSLRIRREDSSGSFSEENPTIGLSRVESQISLAQTISSMGGNSNGGLKTSGFRRITEIDECELRDDLIAWKLPGTVT